MDFLPLVSRLSLSLALTFILCLFDVPSTQAAPVLQINLNKPARYKIDVLKVGKRPYIDRNHTFTRVPPKFRNLCYVRTANDDQYMSGKRFLVLNTNKPTTVYIGFDSRIPYPPEWVKSWTKTRNTLGIQAYYPQKLVLYRKHFPAGKIVLGGNEMGYKTYTVFFKPRNSAVKSRCGTRKNKKIRLSWMPVSSSITGYRVYYGPNRNSTRKIASTVRKNTKGFNPRIPKVAYRSWTDLGMSPGQRVCFRVSALNKGKESVLSDPMCARL